MKIQTATNSPALACSTTTVQANTAMPGVDVTRNTLTTMSTQLLPLMRSNMVEEGIRELAPSSLEISFPKGLVNMPKHHAYQH